ncbi:MULTISPECIES: hypothetical protein [unclassified Dietzia]|uniref:hypothetical protein n=1 Tax=unclassified Dietzia TaxID=2617939 RepID=UPI000D2054AC|nr:MULTISPECIES: hypothetical protein [unclassified Dietzia]AVZ38455.1 hypothetical protein CT688_02090 [Dietzia sp. JS16-p6b]QGW23494.1 TPR repeat protein [Dietzia sp. DQ12-45-1b]
MDDAIKNLGHTAASEFNLGNLAQRSGQFGQARTHYLIARDTYMRLESTREVGACELRLGNVETDLGQFEQARVH